MNIDQWCAEQCGVELRQIRCGDESIAYMWKHNGKTGHDEWTIQDPRCREIVREHFRIETLYQHGMYPWITSAYDRDDECDELVGEGEGKTIAEAECACIQAIWEVEKPCEAKGGNNMNLLETTDVVIWAEEFVRIKKEMNWALDDIDESLMITWFANAMMAKHDQLLRGER